MKFNNFDIYQFKKKLHNKKLVCFGMGQVLQDFLDDFSYMEFEKHISAITDNKIAESGKYTILSKSRIPLIKVNDLIQIADNNLIILISCSDIVDIYNQLNKFDYMKNVDCFAVNFIRSKTNKTDENSRIYPNTFRLTKEQMIPKKIHYCWFGNNPIPEKNKNWINSWKKFCPDYEIIRWDESNYNIYKCQYMNEAYKEKKWGFVSDFARLDIVYKHGGIYLDTDVELIKSYDELLYQPAFCGIEASRKIAIGLGFGAIKKHPVIKGLLDLYKDINFLDPQKHPNLVTCVKLQNPFYKKIGFVNNGDYQIINGMTVYPESVLSPKDMYTGELLIKKNTFSIHHYDASWANKKMLYKTNSSKELYKTLILNHGK